jgi:hypothetical protein
MPIRDCFLIYLKSTNYRIVSSEQVPQKVQKIGLNPKKWNRGNEKAYFSYLDSKNLISQFATNGEFQQF